ncbi:MAG: lysylphosphatidylglycerol synthase transmembrane domain-containing protein [Planctomycetia bacterium]|nr:lysylphosphatidylglycerol synthase transmembrane domain-containing protein [Planctomycetia bacterium]
MTSRKKNKKRKKTEGSVKSASILKQSVDYGVEYGLESGLEAGLRSGPIHGLREGLEEAVVDGVEDAAELALTEEFDPTSGTPEQTDLTGAKRKSKMRRFLFWMKIVVIFLVLGWISWRLEQSWTEIRQYDWRVCWPWILVSSVVYLLAYFPAALLWYLSLGWLGQSPPFFVAIRAFYASQLGKYLPGKAMVVIIRSGMVAGEKVRMSVAAVAVFYETLTMMATGAFLAALVVLLAFREHWTYSVMATGVMFVVGIPLLPPVFLRILKILHIGRNDAKLAARLHELTWRSLACGAGLMMILWLLFGVSLWAAIHGLGVAPGEFWQNLPRYVSVTALAIVLGFAVPITPSGFGIRELVLSTLLIPYFELILAMPENSGVHVTASNLSLIVSLEQRLISIVAELGLVALFFIIPALRFLTMKIKAGRIKRKENEGRAED